MPGAVRRGGDGYTAIAEGGALTVELWAGEAGGNDGSVVTISFGGTMAANEEEDGAAEEKHADDDTCGDTTLGSGGKTVVGLKRVSEGEELSCDDAGGGGAESSCCEGRCQGNRWGGIAGCL